MGRNVQGDLDDCQHQDAQEESQHHHKVRAFFSVDLRHHIGHQKGEGIGDDACGQGELRLEWRLKELDADDVCQQKNRDEGRREHQIDAFIAGVVGVVCFHGLGLYQSADGFIGGFKGKTA